MTESEQIVFNRLRRAVRTGALCPTNAELMGAIGAGSVSAPARIIKRLEARGLIEVRRFHKGRIVFIGDARTATPISNSPHWSDCQDRTPRKTSAPIKRRPERVEEERVRPLFGDLGPRPRTCQYIEHDPRIDASKCGAPVKPGSVYCASHHARCYRKAEEVEP